MAFQVSHELVMKRTAAVTLNALILLPVSPWCPISTCFPLITLPKADFL